MRLNKYLQQAGVGSRREAERLVVAGLVTVNGQVASVTTEVPAGAEVRVQGRPISVATAAQPRLFRYHKPVGVIVTARDHEGRETLYEALAKTPGFAALPRLMPVGRLDLTSEGLLLLTDSGPLAQVLMSPATGLPRTYRVRVHGRLTDAQLAQWRRGVQVAGVDYRGAQVAEEKTSASAQNTWYTVVLNEGKNREIRKIFEHFGCVVNRLIRTAYGPCALGDLNSRALAEVPATTVASLLKQVGLA
ncbi:MAG: rRNA pseudouridine synthase [Alphaproteobacteria bacterium]|jgi:23S rRNA pseudouridine2605 synthase|nr:rRNA pseudouridine synthase [Alphaproteobacteria bacterium]